MGAHRAFDDCFIPEPNSGCWLWFGVQTKDGYGRWGGGANRKLAHRISYERAKGPVPIGMQIDHLCRVRCCVNPDHLEVVTPLENNARGWRDWWHRKMALAQK